MPVIGDRIGRYLLEGELGAGGMGQVFRARDEQLQRTVALKVLAPTVARSSEWSARMTREARAAAAFNHPNAVAVYDVGTIDDAPYLVMEFVDGTPLRKLVDDPTASLSEKIRWLADIARALAAAHRAGLVHRDVKPENVVIREDGVAKVLDFGIARTATSGTVDPTTPTAVALGTLTEAGVTVGTPMYMAPEQIRHENVDGRTDQFAWGVMAYEVLCGGLPWAGTDALSIAASILTSTPAPLASVAPDVPRDVSDAVMRTLAKRAADRFPSMDHVAAALDGSAARASAADTARTATTTGEVVGDVPRPRRAVVASTALLGIVGAVLVAVYAVRRHPAEPTSSSAATSTAAAVPGAVRGVSAHSASEAFFPCRGTKFDTVPPDSARACEGDSVPWCARDGRTIACCPPGLVAEDRDGVCGCPPGGAPSSSPRFATCPHATAEASVSLPAAVIQSSVRSEFPRLRACYEDALKRDPAAHGKVAFYFEIAPNGDVFQARLKTATLPDAAAQRCMLDVARSLHFPPPSGDGGVTVIYPLDFGPDD